MADFLSDQLNTVYSGYLGGVATAGVLGGPTQLRAVEYRGLIKVHRFNVTCVTPVPVPNNAAASIATGDRLFLTLMDVMERIWFGRIYIGAGWGAGVTMAVGKLDRNNSANTDATHYSAAVSVANAGNFDLNLNMTEQVGADTIGDLTTGQKIPQFGSDKIVLTATVTGTVNATGTMVGYIFTTEEGN